MAAVYIVAK